MTWTEWALLSSSSQVRSKATFFAAASFASSTKRTSGSKARPIFFFLTLAPDDGRQLLDDPGEVVDVDGEAPLLGVGGVVRRAQDGSYVGEEEAVGVDLQLQRRVDVAAARDPVPDVPDLTEVVELVDPQAVVDDAVVVGPVRGSRHQVLAPLGVGPPFRRPPRRLVEEELQFHRVVRSDRARELAPYLVRPGPVAREAVQCVFRSEGRLGHPPRDAPRRHRRDDSDAPRRPHLGHLVSVAVDRRRHHGHRRMPLQSYSDPTIHHDLRPLRHDVPNVTLPAPPQPRQHRRQRRRRLLLGGAHTPIFRVQEVGRNF
mmetsp:Transcript_20102/g.64738  ORF Transcript_20102/g.64738 Transcript_20102/m.64738 type:complete len:315 (-) Transcript_20102:7-951(-)